MTHHAGDHTPDRACCTEHELARTADRLADLVEVLAKVFEHGISTARRERKDRRREHRA